MAVRIKARYMVEPSATSTWSSYNKHVIKLSELDEVVGPVHVPTIYFYKPATTGNYISTLRDSLGQALAHYYPLAGRIHKLDGGRLELHVGGSSSDLDVGAELVEAESDSRLDDLEDFCSPNKFQHLIPCVKYYYESRPIQEIPLLMVQLTYLACGGLSLGFLISHAVTDGTGIGYFLKDWCRLARGEALEVYPCHDRTVLRAGEPPRELALLQSTTLIIDQARLNLIRSSSSSSSKTKTKTKTVTIKLTRTQIENLKTAAALFPTTNCTYTRPFSRFEVLASHIWRSVCKARGFNPEDEETKSLGFGISIDARQRLHSFPPKYFGNSSFVVAARTQVGDLLSRPLGYTCQRIRTAIELVNEDYIWSEINFLKRLEDLTVCQELRALSSSGDHHQYVKPDIGVISWLSLPIFELDFGWGKEVYMSPGELLYDGVMHLLPGCDGDGSVEVLVSLRVEHIEQFKTHFYQDI